jgi:hypothetical protein
MADETNKKRKHNSKSKSNKRKRGVQHPTKKRNWIESCSESIHRIPSGCVVPIKCVVSRVELVEEALVPFGDGEMVKCEGKETCGGEAEIEHDVNDTTAAAITDGSDAKKTAQPTSNKQKDASKIAPDRQIATLKLTQDAPETSFTLCNTIQVDDVEKKVFIPVKRHASAIGPTQVSNEYINCKTSYM